MPRVGEGSGMDRYVVRLDEVTDDAVALVGGKAANLATLVRAGLPVPKAAALTTAAFELAVAPYWGHIEGILRDFDLRDPAQAERASRAGAEVLAALSLPAVVEEQLAGSLAELGEGPLAV